MINQIKQQITETLKKVGIEKAELSTPPKADMGEFAFPCFVTAKAKGKNPAEVATDLAEKLNELFTKEEMKQSSLIREVKAFGPYVNFFLDESELATFVLSGIHEAGDTYGSHQTGKGKKVLIEFGCPNPMKVFHLGHLKNLITGEAVVRTFENAGYEVVRVNYQGDVGMHIAKTLWGIYDWMDQFEAMKSETDIRKQVEFLGQAYAHGAQHYEESEEGKQEVIAYNDKIYSRDTSIEEVYTTGRSWSLTYFDLIYKKLGSHFDRLYFESELDARGVDIVNEFTKKGVFKKSEGAVIYEGSAHGLHDRVFINSKGFPTYEAKDLALAEKQFADYAPDMVIHVVGKEQTEYFNVVFQALTHTLPESVGKEYHLPGGFLQLKGSAKMSSRTGNVITGDALLFGIEEKIQEIMDASEKVLDTDVVHAVTAAALKYAMLKSDVTKDVAFDFEASVSTNGDSGPYLLYIVARINSILEKAQEKTAAQQHFSTSVQDVHEAEKELLLLLATYPEATRKAVESYDPSHIAKYTFDLAQAFNTFYAQCPVLGSEDDVQVFRLSLIRAVKDVMTKGLDVLGIATVEEM